MEKLLIIVEGIADAVFLTKYLCFLFKDNEEFVPANEENNLGVGKITKVAHYPEIKILIAGGCTKIKKFTTQIEEYTDSDFSVIVIHDADSTEKDKKFGGFKNRKLYLENVQKDYKITFKSFLFPNNKDDGDLENLLLSIISKDKFNQYFSCYEKYIGCIKEFSGFTPELLENKNKIYNYLQVFLGSKYAKEKNRKFETEYWDMTSESLTPLFLFLKENVNL